jgi:hypothetical protein
MRSSLSKMGRFSVALSGSSWLPARRVAAFASAIAIARA